MIGIVGTVPDLQLPLIQGKVRWMGKHIEIEGKRITVNRCTPALIGAALKASECVHCPEIYAFLIGGHRQGRRQQKTLRAP